MSSPDLEQIYMGPLNLSGERRVNAKDFDDTAQAVVGTRRAQRFLEITGLEERRLQRMVMGLSAQALILISAPLDDWMSNPALVLRLDRLTHNQHGVGIFQYYIELLGPLAEGKDCQSPESMLRWLFREHIHYIERGIPNPKGRKRYRYGYQPVFSPVRVE